MNRAKKQAIAGRLEIDRAEWDFSECPDEEIEACFLYEYARECGDIIADVAFHSHRVPKDQRGTDLPGHPPPPKPTRSDDGFKALCVNLSCLWFLADHFPAKPWSAIPRAERDEFRTLHLYQWKSRDPWA